MNIFKILKFGLDELAAFRASPAPRAHVTTRVGTLYDLYVEPIDLPGPDALIDPPTRAAMVWLSGALYDLATGGDKDPAPWPELPKCECDCEGDTTCD